MREPPQKYKSSMKRAAIQGYWLGIASHPPTIRSLTKAGLACPQTAGKNTISNYKFTEWTPVKNLNCTAHVLGAAAKRRNEAADLGSIQVERSLGVGDGGVLGLEFRQVPVHGLGGRLCKFEFEQHSNVNYNDINLLGPRRSEPRERGIS